MRLFSTLALAVILTGCPDDGSTADVSASAEDAANSAPDSAPGPDGDVIEADLGPVDMGLSDDTEVTDAAPDAATPTRCNGCSNYPHSNLF